MYMYLTICEKVCQSSGSISIITLVVESSLPSRHKLKDISLSTDIAYVNKTCQPEKAVTLSECKRCSKEELRRLIGVCQKTGFKQPIICDNKDKFYQSCEITPYMDERNFWIFEAATFIIFIMSYSMVRIRQKKLDGQLMEKINRQIASGL